MPQHGAAVWLPKAGHRLRGRGCGACACFALGAWAAARVASLARDAASVTLCTAPSPHALLEPAPLLPRAQGGGRDGDGLCAAPLRPGGALERRTPAKLGFAAGKARSAPSAQA